MFYYPEQTKVLATIHLAELKAETDHWRLATAVMKAQQPANKHQPSRLGALHTLIIQYCHKWSLPRWEVVVKHG